MNLFRRRRGEPEPEGPNEAQPAEPQDAGDGTTEHFFTVEIAEGDNPPEDLASSDGPLQQQGRVILDSDANEQSTLAEIGEGSMTQLPEPDDMASEPFDATDDLVDLC